MSYDQPSPKDQHFARKLKSVASLEELQGFENGLIERQGALTTEQQHAIATRRAELQR